MLRLEKFAEGKVYMYPNGTVATSERIKADFPAVAHFTHVIEVNGDMCQAVMNLKALRNQYKIDDALTEDEAIAVIQVTINTPPPVPEPTAEERIAAQLEYQSMMML